jgi:hypothetical protein
MGRLRQAGYKPMTGLVLQQHMDEQSKALFVSIGLVGRNDFYPDCFSNLYKL